MARGRNSLSGAKKKSPVGASRLLFHDGAMTDAYVEKSTTNSLPEAANSSTVTLTPASARMSLAPTIWSAHDGTVVSCVMNIGENVRRALANARSLL